MTVWDRARDTLVIRVELVTGSECARGREIRRPRPTRRLNKSPNDLKVRRPLDTMVTVTRCDVLRHRREYR
jgi:hypothetical protein